MNNGIWQVARARLCLPCAEAMDALKGGDYVLRCDGHLGKTPCERCGRELMTMVYRYTMSGKALRRLGRENG